VPIWKREHYAEGEASWQHREDWWKPRAGGNL